MKNATRRKRNARKFKLSEEVVVLGQRTSTLEDLDQDGGGEAEGPNIVGQVEIVFL
jgi:hypothetical protein